MATNTTQTLELTQALQTIKWLDEERRKDKATIATLQEQMQGLDRQLAQQGAQIQEMQTALAGAQSVLSQVTEFRRFVSSYRDELVLQMDQREETRRKEQIESDRLRRMEYEALTSNLNRLEKELSVLSRWEEDMSAFRAETRRLNEAFQRMDVSLGDLGQRSDDRVQAVTYLEEQRRTDNRRISDLEQDATELHKRIEVVNKKVPLLEDTLRKQTTRIDEAIQETKKFEKPIEELRISDFQREQKMKQYVDQAEHVAREMERIREQTQGFIQQQQLVRQAQNKLERFQARIEKRQNEVAEMQRVAEDRLKRQWEEWQDKQDKQQKKRDVITEERWREQGRTNDVHLKRLDALRSEADQHRAQLDTLWELRRSDTTSLLKSAQEKYEAETGIIDEQLSTLHSKPQEK
jgi:DNA repair exonuclease SbcCD ATPase subunit